MKILDCVKVGKLLYDLRKEKNMTQKQVAELMNISDKTISKWERGLGCPDVSLLPELSQIFGVSIDGILSGELNQNPVVGGNMRRLKFFVCSQCGNIMTVTGDTVILGKQYPEWNLQFHFHKRKHGKLFYYCSNHGLYYQVI